MTIKRISFRTKVIVLIEIIANAINLVLAFFVWNELDHKVREITRGKLVAIASTTAEFINVSCHEKIREEKDEDSAAYENVHNFLKKMMAANPEADDIYTFRKTDEEGVWAFVAGGYEETDKNADGVIEEDEEPVGIGEEFDPLDYPMEILESFDRPIAEREINCDKWGCWLSGYAPIYDENGEAVAVAAVDMRADDIIAFERRARAVIFAVLMAIFIVYPVILYLVLRRLLRPVSAIVSGMEKFKADLGSRLAVESRDEFGLISETFNKMAGELESLYRGLEEKVEEKTKELALRVKEIEKKNAEDEALLGSIGEGMMAFDWNGRIIVVNARAEQMLGKSGKELIGQNCSEVVALTDDKGKKIQDDRRPIQSSLKSGRRQFFSEYYFSRNDGARFPVAITVSPVMIEGKIVGAIAVFRDITREKEVDKAKSEFVSLASHQLLTPLSSINWYTEMLLDASQKKDKAKKEKYLDKIHKANQRMVGLVNSLLNVSRIEMGIFSIEREKINLKEMAESLLDELKPQSQAKNLKIGKKFAPEIGSFEGDARLMRMIMQNLLSNAVKYSREKGKITVSAERDAENGYVIRVSDNGYGIPESQQSKIFTKMFRADNIKEKVIEGTGLGLYIAKSIVEAGGGSITFESAENKGATFEVVFPASGMKPKEGIRKLS